MEDNKNQKWKRPLLCLVCACCFLAMSGCVTIIEEEPSPQPKTEQEENRQQEKQEVQQTEQPKQETQPSSVQANNAYGEKVYDAFVMRVIRSWISKSFLWRMGMWRRLLTRPFKTGM